MRTLTQILDMLKSPNCDHPGCHELHGSDDAREELKGTQYEKDISRFISDTIKRADSESDPATKIALLDMAQAAIMGTGFRDACRRFRAATLHSD